eukprot:UN4750
MKRIIHCSAVVLEAMGAIGIALLLAYRGAHGAAFLLSEALRKSILSWLRIPGIVVRLNSCLLFGSAIYYLYKDEMWKGWLLGLVAVAHLAKQDRYWQLSSAIHGWFDTAGWQQVLPLLVRLIMRSPDLLRWLVYLA